ncbi:MAG: sigma-70 family RNA polymerase sigma factor [Myxococcota bacterium]
MTVATALRLAYPRALAILVRLVGDLGRAEDLLQEAATRATERWREVGVPQHPAAWLVRAARNLDIDDARRHRVAERYLALAHPEASVAPAEPGLRDDMLRLIFICCHPVLGPEAQVALTLKAVAGLTVEETARAFLVPTKTMEQRITRAKRRIRESGARYEIPSELEQPARLNAVMAVLHLIFNEGHSATGDWPPIRQELCHLAIGRSRLLLRLHPMHAELEGLVALFLLTHARTPSRLGADGELVRLDRQDRRQWNRVEIVEGLALLEQALRRGRPGPYQLQAAISAVHCRARRYEDTDWTEIVKLYDAWCAIAPSPIVLLNRAVAVSRVAGPAEGLRLLDALAEEPALVRGHAFFAARAALFEELGEAAAATGSFRDAASRATNPAEREYFAKQLRRLAPEVRAGASEKHAENLDE